MKDVRQGGEVGLRELLWWMLLGWWSESGVWEGMAESLVGMFGERSVSGRGRCRPVGEVRVSKSDPVLFIKSYENTESILIKPSQYEVKSLVIKKSSIVEITIISY